MAQTTILAANTTAATSSDVAVTAGSTISIGVFSAAMLPGGVCASLLMDTPSGDVVVHQFTRARPAVAVTGPGTYRVVRPAGSVSLGAFSET